MIAAVLDVQFSEPGRRAFRTESGAPFRSPLPERLNAFLPSARQQLFLSDRQGHRVDIDRATGIDIISDLYHSDYENITANWSDIHKDQ